MDELVPLNVHLPYGERSGGIRNPYARAVQDAEPRELVDFELRNDPYANMLPNVSRLVLLESPGDDEVESRKRHPLQVAVSLLLLAAFVLPLTLAVIQQLAR